MFNVSKVFITDYSKNKINTMSHNVNINLSRIIKRCKSVDIELCIMFMFPK